MIDNITKREPFECSTITQVRDEIDAIDEVILQLLGKRFEYVKEVVKYKVGTASSVEASDRRTAVLQQRRQWAEQQGLNPDVVEKMYIDLIDYFIKEEKKILKIQ